MPSLDEVGQREIRASSSTRKSLCKPQRFGRSLMILREIVCKENRAILHVSNSDQRGRRLFVE